ncbi:disintegrin and metalloproteinase domain-containing protein 9-like isoform X2 [Mixophyes fleayi]|uniref:disintegrin and metalloproteinase domain-containing protein 9-like isoform X2 n=1 Tax=Mixophyes fleayi TaxID=3061075 RepID=UPI003F4D75CA
MSAQLVLAVCLMGVTWVRSQDLPLQQFLGDLDIERIDSQSWTEDLEDDYDYKNKQTVSSAGADSYIVPSYEIIEPKQISPSVPEEPLLYSITIAKKPLTMFLMKQGLIEFSDESFIIEPFQLTSGFLHLVSKMEGKYVADISISENDTDVKSHSYQHKLFKQFEPSSQLKASIFGIRRYMKVALFVTVEVYKALGGSPTNVITNLMQVFSYLNTKFAPFNMEIFLSSIDLWTVSNLCSIVESASDTLENFVGWLSGIAFNLRSYDIPLLIVDGQHSEIGTTYFGQMCSYNNGAVLTYPKGLSLEKYSCLVAHILGHNLGMLHDHSRECICSASACIMNVSVMTADNAKSFSSCSLKDFQTFVMKTGVPCLLTHPNIKPLVDPSLCGNRLLDSGESCDCGTKAECENDSCCDYDTCTLKAGASCANGACCSNCQFLPARTLCRRPADECDLPEYCSGTTPTCPEDLFQQNGNLCNDKSSFCYKGLCQNADIQCRQLFGPAARNADLDCYQELNVIGDRFGNCGGFGEFYASCHIADVLCGKLQCMIMDTETVTTANLAISYYAAKHHMCVTADSLTDNNPLWVKDGTKCGENKMCIKQKCMNISSSDLSCERETTCNWHGICNNKHKCHCDAGWKPPLCNKPDDTLFIRSGRVADDTGKSGDMACTHGEDLHLVNWLLVGFLLILPLLIIILYLIRRNFLQKLNSSEPYKDNGEETSTGDQCSESFEEETEKSEERDENLNKP